MTGTRSQITFEAMQTPHDPAGWLSLGVFFAAIGLLHLVFPLFMWRMRRVGARIRNRDLTGPSATAFTTDRVLGAATAAIGIGIVVLVEIGVLT
jgi:hypothetical protein